MSIENETRNCGCGNKMLNSNIDMNSTIGALNNNWMMNDNSDSMCGCDTRNKRKYASAN